jgi:hypothetical protein
MITSFGPLGRQLKEGFILGFNYCKIPFQKGPTLTFLGDYSTAEFFAATES